LHPNVCSDDGFVLVIVMLFLSILSLLALGILEINLLENKMSAFFQDKVNSFYQAEEYLLQAEMEMRAGNLPANDVNIKITKIGSGIFGVLCEVNFYRLRAKASCRGIDSVLWSTFLKVGDIAGCSPEFDLITGRQSFWIER
jgi:Tfp pilus assembly protein PilX